MESTMSPVDPRRASEFRSEDESTWLELIGFGNYQQIAGVGRGAVGDAHAPRVSVRVSFTARSFTRAEVQEHPGRNTTSVRYLPPKGNAEYFVITLSSRSKVK